MNNYKELLKKIEEFKKAQLWSYVDGDDIFCLKGFSENVYISVLGHAKCEYGLVIMKGEEDFISQLAIAFGAESNLPDFSLRLKAYKIVIGDPMNLISSSDKKTLKENNIKPKDVSIRMDAGKLPRLVNEEECLFLIEVIDKLLLLAQNFKNKKVNTPEMKISKYIYSYTFEKDKITVTKEDFPKYEIKPYPQEKIDNNYIKMIKQHKKHGTINVWLLYFPMYDKKTNQYPLVLLIIDSKTKFLYGIEIIEQNNLDKITNKVLEKLARLNLYPKEISVNDFALSLTLEQLERELNLTLSVDYYDDFMHFLYQQLSNLPIK